MYKIDGNIGLLFIRSMQYWKYFPRFGRGEQLPSGHTRPWLNDLP